MARLEDTTTGRSLLDRLSTGTDGSQQPADGYGTVEEAVRQGVVDALSEYEEEVVVRTDTGASSGGLSRGQAVAGAAGVAGLAYAIRRRRRRRGAKAPSETSRRDVSPSFGENEAETQVEIVAGRAEQDAEPDAEQDVDTSTREEPTTDDGGDNTADDQAI